MLAAGGHARRRAPRAAGRIRIEERADVEGVAVTAAGGHQPRAHRLCARDELVDLGELALGELAHPGVRRGPATARGQQHARLVEREAGALGHVDDLQPAQRVGAVAALATLPLGLGEQADGLVVADGRGLQPRLAGDLADGERRFVHCSHPLDLKSA